MKTVSMYNDKLLIKLPSEMKQKIQKIAEDNNQTVSEYIRRLIAKEIKENNK